MYKCLSKSEVLYPILSAFSPLEKNLHVQKPCVFFAVLGYWSKKRLFFPSFLFYCNLGFQLCNLLHSLLFLNKFNFFFKVIQVTMKGVLGACTSESREVLGATYCTWKASVSCLLEFQELVTSSYIKLMGGSVFWQAPMTTICKTKAL